MKKLIIAILSCTLVISSFTAPISAAGNWVQENNTWHVYQDGQMIENDWYQDNGKWYFLNGHGEITTGWMFEDHIWYYLGTDGVMRTGWQKIDNTWYYFRGNGQMFKGWLQVKSGAPWYYLNSSGKMVVGWQQIDGKWYYFDNTGKMLANTTVDGYKLGPGGAMIDEDADNKYSLSHDKNILFQNFYYPEDVFYATMLSAKKAKELSNNPDQFKVKEAYCYNFNVNNFDRYFVIIETESEEIGNSNASSLWFYLFDVPTLELTPPTEWTQEEGTTARYLLRYSKHWYFTGEYVNRAVDTLK